MLRNSVFKTLKTAALNPKTKDTIYCFVRKQSLNNLNSKKKHLAFRVVLTVHKCSAASRCSQGHLPCVIKTAHYSELTYLSEKYQIPFLGYNQKKSQFTIRRSIAGGFIHVVVVVENLEIAIPLCRSMLSLVQN